MISKITFTVTKGQEEQLVLPIKGYIRLEHRDPRLLPLSFISASSAAAPISNAATQRNKRWRRSPKPPASLAGSLLVWRHGRVTEAKKGIIWSVREMSAQMNLDGQKQFARDLEIQKLSPPSPPTSTAIASNYSWSIDG